MKKVLTLVLALALVICAACASATTVGVLQLVQHPALDAATQGFVDALTEAIPDVKIDIQNASGDTATCSTIANGFVSNGVDLIMANATPAVAACMAATGEIPILGTSVTEYFSTLDITEVDGATGINVSGTSDLPPLDQQAAMVLELFPETKKVGLMYCSAEANSVYQIQNVAKYLADMGVETQEFAFVDSNDIASVAQAAADSVDVIYIPTDNTAAAYTETIANVLIPAGVPAICGEEGICSGCGVATLSIKYYDIGVATGKMAADILLNGADVSTMKIQFAPEFTKEYNVANCEALGITPPADYVAIAE